MKSTNHYKKDSRLLSILIKALPLFMLYIFNFYSARNYTSDKDKIHIISGKEIITSGVSVPDLRENNFEIIKINDIKGHFAARIKAIKNHKAPKAEFVKHGLVQTLPKKDKTHTSGTKSDYAFSVHQNRNTAVIQSQNTLTKNLLRTNSIYLNLTIFNIIKTKIPTLFAHFSSKMYLESSSVRPPPRTFENFFFNVTLNFSFSPVRKNDVSCIPINTYAFHKF